MTNQEPSSSEERPASAIAITLARKFERALRNGTGANFTLSELVALVDVGALDAIQRIRNEELVSRCRAKLPSIPRDGFATVTQGSHGGATGGKSHRTTEEEAQAYIAALTANA